METIRLRPHHVLDIVAYWKADDDPDYVRKPGENGVRTVCRMMARSLDIPAEFIVGWDFICEPCSHLQPDGRCDQILAGQVAMDDYNDPLDRRILDCLGMQEGVRMTVREFLKLANEHVPGVETVSHRASEGSERRRDALIKGLVELGIRSGEA